MKYRITFIPAFGENVEFTQECESLELARLLVETIASYTLMLHKGRLMPDYSNMHMIEMQNNEGYWEEVEECVEDSVVN